MPYFMGARLGEILTFGYIRKTYSYFGLRANLIEVILRAIFFKE